MAIAPGTRFGHYEIAAAIGSGGMGEVYRAKDTSLKRDVALKFLPQAFAADADRVARFQREAEALAALNHPNIAQVYGLERSEGSTAIVMELIEGLTLADRIAQSPIAYDDALGIANQIIAALEAAHGRSIVHRDLKPANIKVRGDNTVKVLDFGIATAPESPLATSGRRSPTLLTPALTEAGILLGTAAYMAPEQARGRPVDQRADIWAFGCVLYEMLTGQPAFTGEDVTTTLARVLEREANLSALPAAVPARVHHTLELCLEKDPSKRIADIRDVKLALDGRFGAGARIAVQASAPARPFWRRLPAPAAALIIAVALTSLVAWSLRPMPDAAITRFSVDLAGPLIPFRSIALSPDGRRVVYATNDRLYSQRLDQNQATVLPGTEGGHEPFFSPGGDSIAFFTTTQLKAVGFGGEIPRVLANIAAATGLVGAWHPDGQLLFGQAGAYGLSSVAAVGGEPEPFADLGDYADLDYPDVLPGGDWVLFTANVEGNWSGAQIVAQNRATGERRIVLEGGHFARYAPTGHLLFARNATLHAVAFDPERLETRGPAVPVVQGIATDETSGHAKYAVAANGTLIYVPGSATSAVGLATAVVRVDRAGNARPLSTELRDYDVPRVSPDGTRIAVEVTSTDQSVHLWIMDLATGGATQLTLEGAKNRHPVWTLDSRDVLFTSNRGEAWAIYRQAADGTGEPVRVVEGTEQLAPTDVLPGNVLLYQDTGEAGYRDILTFDLDGDGPATVFLATPDDERSARASPDGAWIAYVSDSGNVVDPKIYARPYPRASGGLRAIPEGDGAAAVWSASGEEIYFLGPPPGPFLSVPIARTATTITPGRPEELFDYGSRFRGDDALSVVPYDVLPSGDGIVAVQLAGLSASDSEAGTAARPQINVVLNWFEELQRLVPTE